MYNKDLFEKLRQEFGDESMPRFCQIVSRMYDIIYNNEFKNHYYKHCSEANFERDWWYNKLNELMDKI